MINKYSMSIIENQKDNQTCMKAVIMVAFIEANY